jgi:hypothetical protein
MKIKFWEKENDCYHNFDNWSKKQRFLHKTKESLITTNFYEERQYRTCVKCNKIEYRTI